MRASVALAACPDYAPARVAAALETLVGLLGGLEGFVRPGQTVLLKPNLLSDKTPERAVTTHPEVARAVIRWVRARGGRPVVADSACSAIQIEQVWDRTGFGALCAAEGVPLLNLEQAGSVPFRFGRVTYSVARPVLEADRVINLPKLKTHMLTGLTNAVKNVYGTLPGFQKTLLHREWVAPRAFSAFLAELYARVRPGLTLCDAVVGMDGPGPSAGDPAPLGLLAASADGVALDAALCRLLGIPLWAAPYLGLLGRAGAGVVAADRIDRLGELPPGWGRRRFRLPRTAWLNRVPVWVPRTLRRWIWIRPAFTPACVRCGRCLAACPVRALSLPDDGRSPPRLAASACIGCCCCHEVCPRRAVVMTQSRLLRLRHRGRLPS